MRLAADDVARSLRGSWHLMTRGAEALPELDLTRDGFWRSFLAFALMLPATIAILAAARLTAGLPNSAGLFTAPALVLWAQYFGNRAGDRLDLTLSGPQNTRISETITLDRTQARGFRAFGKRLRDPAGWPRGDWLAEAALIRDGIEIDRQTVPFRVGD